MRIAFVIKTFPELSETFILNQITGLIDRGHEVDIFAGQRGDAGEMQPDIRRYRLMERTRFTVPHAKSRLKRSVGALKLAVSHVPENPRAVLGSLNVLAYGRRAASFRLLHEIVPFLPRRDYDIIQCHYGMLGTHAALMKKVGVLTGRIVVMFHGFDIRQGREQGPGMYREIMGRDIHVLSISSYNRANLLEFGFPPDNIVNHPVGIDMKRFPFRRPRQQPSGGSGRECVKILTVGRLVREKGLEYGLQAIAEVLARDPSRRVQYTIVGDGEQRDELQELAAALKLGGVVTFAGGQDQRHVRRELQRADLFLLPSRNEALPVCLMEAQASGLPVVATSVGSVHEIVRDGHSGFLVPPGDAIALADRLAYLIDNPQVWRGMGQAGREHVEARYDVNRLNDRLIRIYEAILRGNGALDGLRAPKGPESVHSDDYGVCVS